jgi:hypothetical protein
MLMLRIPNTITTSLEQSVHSHAGLSFLLVLLGSNQVFLAHPIRKLMRLARSYAIYWDVATKKRSIPWEAGR